MFLLSVSWESRFPAEAGLKSSSAVLSCVASALEAMLRPAWGVEEWGRVIAVVSRREGLSITGAYDDAVATLGKGVYVTDNRVMRVLAHFPSGGLEALVAWKGGTRPIASVRPEDFARLAPYYRAAHALALGGRWVEAMLLNGVVTSIALGEGGDFIQEALSHPGTRAAGVTGKGPALFAVGSGIRDLASRAEDLGYRVIVSRLA